MTILTSHLSTWCKQVLKQQLASLQVVTTELAAHLTKLAEKHASAPEEGQTGQAALQQRLRKIELTVAGIPLSRPSCKPCDLHCQIASGSIRDLKKRKREKTTHFGVNLMRSQVLLYQAARLQGLL